MNRIFIDPGHGGSDPGSRAIDGTPEAVFNLKLANRLTNMLANYYTVAMSHTGNGMSLADRVAKAKAVKAEVAIFIHCNAHYNKEANGLEVFYGPGNKLGKGLATDVYNNVFEAAKMQKYFYTGRGVKEYGYYVLRSLSMPACLIECGFITNERDFNWLNSARGQVTVAYGMAIGLFDFLKGW